MHQDDKRPAVGPYRLLRELARGGMGAVHEAVHEETGSRYALKTLLPGLVGGAGSEELERFRREAQVMGRLNHPHVARVHAADLDGPTPYLVQDFLSGGTLQERIQAGPLAIEEAVEIASKLGRGLQHSHEHGVLHRDLKPLNVMFDGRGEPQLVDFGLAHALELSQRLTETGTVMGTPSHMAPEQATGSRDVDARTDVYGLGAILYHCLVGAPPFRGASVLAILHAVTSEAPTPPSAARADVPPWLDAVVLRALAKKPSDRFQSSGALVDDLEAGAAGVGSKGSGRGLWPVLLFAATAVLGLVGLGLSALGPGSGVQGSSPTSAAPNPDAGEEAPELFRSEARGLALALEAVEWLRKGPDRVLPAKTVRQLRVDRRLEERGGFEHLLGARFVGAHANAHAIAVFRGKGLTLLSLSTGLEETFVATPGDPIRNASSWDGDTLALAGGRGWVIRYDLEGAEVSSRTETEGRIRALAFSPAGDEVAIGSDAVLYLWRPPADPEPLGLSGEDMILELAYVPKGDRLVLARGSPTLGESNYLEVLRKDPTRGWIREWKSEELGRKPSALAVDPSGTVLAVGDQLGGARLFSLVDLERAAVRLRWEPKPGDFTSRVTGLRFSPDGNLLFASSGSNSSIQREARKPPEVIVWRVKDREILDRRSVGGGTRYVRGLDLFGPDAEIVLLELQGNKQDNLIELWWRDALLPELREQ